MSKARQKGTSWETALLGPLRSLFGEQVERAPLKGIQDKGDFVGVPWQHEAKSTQKPLFLEWARKATAKSYPWVILWKGDLRKNDQGPYVLMPFALYETIMYGYLATERRHIRADPSLPRRTTRVDL